MSEEQRVSVVLLRLSEQVFYLVVRLDDLSLDHSAVEVVVFELVDLDALLS